MIDALSWEVLNATADDWESLAQIHPAVCRRFASTRSDAVTAVIARLVALGLLEQRRLEEPGAECWVRMTKSGRKVWQDAAQYFRD